MTLGRTGTAAGGGRIVPPTMSGLTIYRDPTGNGNNPRFFGTWTNPGSTGKASTGGFQYDIKFYKASDNSLVGTNSIYGNSGYPFGAGVHVNNGITVTAGTDYYYKITIIDRVSGLVGQESAASATLKAATLPGTPSISGVTGGTNNVSISFSVPNNGGLNLSNYKVEFYYLHPINNTYSLDRTDTAGMPGNSTSPFTIGCSPGTYYIKLFAQNELGYSSASQSSSFTVVAPPFFPPFFPSFGPFFPPFFPSFGPYFPYFGGGGGWIY